MKRVFASFVFAMFVAGMLSVSSPAQSLGEVAREQRAKKPAPSPGGKVYTNDTIASGASVSDSGSSASSQPAPAADSAAASGGPSASASSAAEDRTKAEADWKAKFAEQRKVIAGLEKELDVLKRENKLRAASFYGDAGTRLRDEKKYAEDDRKYKANIEAKEQEVAAAKQKFSDMQEEARKAGMSSRVSDPE